MPRVPEYGGFQVAPQIAPGQTIAGVSPEAAQRSNLGNQAIIAVGQKAANTAVSIALDVANEANTLRVKEVLTNLRAEEQRLTFDQTEGYLTLQGGNALNRGDKGSLDQEYGQRLKNYGDQLRASLSNEAQRKAFDEQAGGVYTQFGSGIQQHMLKQYYVYGDSVRQAEAERIAQGMLLTDSPEALAQGVNDLTAIAYEYARTYGKEVDVAKVTGPALRRVIEAKISAGYLGTAKRLRETFKDYLSAEDIASVKAAYQAENEFALANNASMEAYRISQEKGMQAAVSYLDKQGYNIKERAINMFNGRIAQQKQVQEEIDTKTKASVFGMILAGQHVTPDMYARASSETKKSILEFQTAVEGGKYITTDAEAYIELMRGINSGRFDVTDALTYRDRISKSDWDKVQAALVKVNSLDESGRSTRDRAIKTIFDEAMRIGKVKGVDERVKLYEAAQYYYDDNKGKVDSPTGAAVALLRESSSYGGGRYYEEIAQGNRRTFEADADYFKAAAEQYSFDYPQWQQRKMDDFTVRTLEALRKDSNYWNQDASVRNLLKRVQAKMAVEQGVDFVPAWEATQLIQEAILYQGLSAADIRRWSLTNAKAKITADDIKRYESISKAPDF